MDHGLEKIGLDVPPRRIQRLGGGVMQLAQTRNKNHKPTVPAHRQPP